MKPAQPEAAPGTVHDKGIGRGLSPLGSRGVWLSVNGEGRRSRLFKVNAVDTTIAAGDTFNGAAYVTALLEGKPADEAVHFAHAAAAIAVTAGVQPSVPWRREGDASLRSVG